jgi:hypothetical protein|uniref:Secreted protein n=1 Tax=Zea mays TaxID=4577 RepID=C0HG66_MAIZE|nr:unknown [Zea mays]
MAFFSLRANIFMRLTAIGSCVALAFVSTPKHHEILIDQDGRFSTTTEPWHQPKSQTQMQIRFDHVLVPQSAGLRRHVKSMHAMCCACNITCFFYPSFPAPM